MTKKDLKKFIKINFRYFGKKLHLSISDTLGKINPEKGKFSVSDEDIDNVSLNLEKMFRIIESCKYTEHIDVTERCANVFNKRFPFAVIINKILERKIENKRKTLAGYYEFNEK